MNQEQPQLTLIGRTSSWSVRTPVDPDRVAAAGSLSSNFSKPTMAAWLHHRGCGTIGVYLAADADTHGVVLRRGQWLRITGTVRPSLVYALPDDPRSARSIDYTPLFLAVRQIQHVGNNLDWRYRPQLPSTHQVRVRTQQGVMPLQIRSVISWPDTVYWTAGDRTPFVFAHWNNVYGVVTRLGKYRYLRYVLSLDLSVAHPKD